MVKDDKFPFCVRVCVCVCVNAERKTWDKHRWKSFHFTAAFLSSISSCSFDFLLVDSKEVTKYYDQKESLSQLIELSFLFVEQTRHFSKQEYSIFVLIR